MGVWGKLLIAAAAPLLLAGCLWTPGKFTSELALRKGGAFVLDYRGEIIFQVPDDKGEQPPAPWNDSMAQCVVGGAPELHVGTVTTAPATDDADAPKKRSCSAGEIATVKELYRQQGVDQAERTRKQADEMAKMFGLPGADDESNRRFAASLMKYKGWRSVAYRGKGVFDVDYHFEGRADQDYAFPMMPDSNLVMPFVAIRRRSDGAVLVTAPALTGGSGPFGARALAMGLPNSEQGPKSLAEGRFTITTDGDILTNNSEDGPVTAGGGKRVVWVVGPGSQRIPEMLVRL
ncbi:MAG: hypothetical protein ABI626_10670 [Sphingomicrobium sp.]